MEAITKYAINSSLGTSQFKPLDKIIWGAKSLVASDSDYYKIGNYTISGGTSNKPAEKTVFEAVLNVSGSMRLTFTAYNTNAKNSVGMIVYKNGTEVGSAYSFRNNSLADGEKKIDFTFSAGDSIKINARTELSGTEIKDIMLKAQTVDLNCISITSNSAT